MNESQFKTLRELSTEGTVSQRDLSKKVGLSLGSVNYSNKAAYVYVLTPHGINARIQQTQYFLQVKMEEYEKLQKEIEELKKENRTIENKDQ
jgi:hypothetical protein